MRGKHSYHQNWNLTDIHSHYQGCNLQQINTHINGIKKINWWTLLRHQGKASEVILDMENMDSLDLQTLLIWKRTIQEPFGSLEENLEGNLVSVPIKSTEVFVCLLAFAFFWSSHKTIFLKYKCNDLKLE